MADAKEKTDPRDDQTKRLTSHLNTYRLPETEAVEADEEVKLGEVSLPSEAKDVLALLKEAQGLTVSSRADQAIKNHRINKLSAHLHAIQQGPEAPVFTAKNSRKMAAAQTDMAKAMLVEHLGRQHPVVKELADENAELRAELELLKNPKK